MSNQTRRQNLGLGKTARGGSGGSFASHERGAAAPPPASSAVGSDAVVSDPFTVRWTEYGVLPTPRHRKPRDVQRSFEMAAEVRSVSRDDTGEAFTMDEFIGGSGNLEFEVRHYDGELYRPMVAGDIWSYTNKTSEPPYPNPTDRLEATPERIRERLTRFERNWDTGEHEYVTNPYQGSRGDDSEQGAREMVQAEVDGYLSIDGELWRKTEEPTYSVSTFGLGSNHGGTGMFLDTKNTPRGDELNRRDTVFTLDEFEEAKAHALNVASYRGDTESIRRIEEQQPVVVPKDRPWRHPKSATRIGEYTSPTDIPWAQRDDFQAHQAAFTGLKRQIADRAPHALYKDEHGRQRVDLKQLTESVEYDYQELSKKVRNLRTLDDEF